MQRGAEEFCELNGLPAAPRQSRIRFLLESCSAALQARYLSLKPSSKLGQKTV